MRRLEILAVEDSPTDLAWLEHVMAKSGLEYKISVANDGAKAVDFLLKRGGYADAPDPDLVLLDVHLPKATGYEALRQIPHAQKLPICVLTSSSAEQDLFRREFGIAGAKYLIKPVSTEALLACLRSYDHLRPIVEELSPLH
jgi:two-component system, chemotaxis family, response regulator Rcp1